MLLLPLDERPINVAFPRLLAAPLGWQALVPRELLGSRKQPGKTDEMAAWLLEGFSRSVGAIISVDMLVWGGLIPSRITDTPQAEGLGRLEVLRELRAFYPNKPILAFSTIQRISRENHDGEEAEYYRSHGRAIFRRSVLEHQERAAALDDAGKQELAALRQEVPAAAWEDFTARRRRNHAINRAAIDLVDEGVIDFLVLNQDDTTTWGLNVEERARLEDEVRVRQLGRRVMVYPGADEVAQILMARLAAMRHHRRVLLAPFYASRSGAGIQTEYEDRPLGDLIMTHVRAAGGALAPAHVRPDVTLAVNSPSVRQGHGFLQLAPKLDTQGVLSEEQRVFIEQAEAQVRGLDRSLEAFADSVEATLERGGRVGVADVAHTNGADDELVSLLARAGLLQAISGYGGWNTAGNALGSAVALSCIAAMTSSPVEHARALSARYVDDWLYQSRVRTQLMVDPELHPYGFASFLPDERLPEVSGRIGHLLNQEVQEQGLPFVITRVALPWKRLFEIDFSLEAAGAPSQP